MKERDDTVSAATMTLLSEQGCACTCCSGHWQTVSITLRCSGGCGCAAGTDLGGRVLDLYRDAFSRLADPELGILRVRVTW